MLYCRDVYQIVVVFSNLNHVLVCSFCALSTSPGIICCQFIYQHEIIIVRKQSRCLFYQVSVKVTNFVASLSEGKHTDDTF